MILGRKIIMPAASLRPLLLLLFTMLWLNSATATNMLRFGSGEAQTTLIELYTSEGCSSCPAADRWLGSFKESELLWQHIIPVAFHVNYWDYLGWKDEFARERYTQRQYSYRRLNYVSAVYTPGVMKNGREFRGWRWGLDVTDDKQHKPGVLSARLDAQNLQVSFAANGIYPSLLLNIAWLGTDLKSDVQRGENSGKVLNHDFVVLEFQQLMAGNKTSPYTWQLARTKAAKDPRITAVAIWLSERHDPTPIQASGAWIRAMP